MKKINRRKFLKGSAAAATTLVASPLLSSSVSKRKDDYKALVCILLEGGADSLNMVLPTKTGEYADYKDAKEKFAIKREHILSLRGTNYGLHPSLKKSQRLYNRNKMAIVANVGTLIKPLSREEIKRAKSGFGSIELPYQLFNHVTQREAWMRVGDGDKGWAAKFAELYGGELTNVSLGGQNGMQSGGEYAPLIANDESFGVLNDKNGIFRRLRGLSVDTFFEKSDTELLGLGEQLETVVRFIHSRDILNAPKRQIFFVKSTGWDTHNDISDSESRYGKSGELMAKFDSAVGEFIRSLESLGLEDKVTAFTISDFGRTIASSTKEGFDHGWGGHAFVYGGAVKGGKIYGDMPQIKRDSPDILANGAVVPTTPVEHYLESVANWLYDGKIDSKKLFANIETFGKNQIADIV
jgi:uncharacterized protein (DUF1501 family)